MEKVISIIIPSYNMENYLNKCCDSMLSCQRFIDWGELIIVNDGSKDSTLSIAQSYLKRFPTCVRVIDKNNGNYGSCVNAGLQEATGVFVKVLDADDYFDTNNLSHFIGKLQSVEDSDVDLVITNSSRVDESGNVKFVMDFDFKKGEILDFSTYLTYDPFSKITMHSLTYRRLMLLNMKYHQLEGISYTDQQWVLLPMLNIRKVVYFPYNLYQYLVGRAGQTMELSTFKKNHWMQVKNREYMLDFMLQNCVYNSIQNCVYVFDSYCKTVSVLYSRVIIDKYDEGPLREFDDFLLNKCPLVDGIMKKEDSNLYSMISKWRKGKHLRFPVFVYKVKRKLKI